MDSKQGKRETNRRGEIMLKAVFSRFGEEIELTDELWQYDFGQKIQVTGIELPDVCEVHFQYDNLTETKTVTGYKQEDALIIDIPNEALTSRGIIKLYIYLVSSEEGRTVNVAIMHVNRRMKPEGFEVPEDIDLFHHTLLAANEYMQQTKNAKKSAETAADQAESARESAETASDQAEDAKNAAEEAADEAKTAKENAETAAKVAEAFKTEAETARSEAVRAATESTDAKDSAEKSRAATEKAKQDAEAAKAAADADKEAAEAAQAKAEAAQKAAENAETEAKKAQTATENAKTAVKNMQSTVAGYADNANVAKEAAETARSEAETAKNDAVQAKEAAERAKIGTAADRETTETASKAARISATSAEESAKKVETAKEEIQESADQIQKNAIEIDSLKENKITKPAEVPTIGKILRVKSVNEDSTFVCEWADSASELDVRINGESIVQNGIAEIPVAGFTSPTQIRRTGLVCVPSGYGIDFQYNTHNLIISNPSTDLIDRRNNMWQADYYATTLRKIDYAVKAAMCDGKGTAWTAEEQAAARERMGIDEWELACDVTLEKDSNNVIIQLNGDYSEVYGILKFPVVPSGEHRMMFYDTNNGSWNNTQGAFCQDVRCNERTFIHAGIYDSIAIFDYHGQTQTLAPYPYPVSRSMRECKDTRINAFATFAFTSPSGTNFKIWGRKI